MDGIALMLTLLPLLYLTQGEDTVWTRLWLALADMFINAEKYSDAHKCIEEAKALTPLSANVETCHGRLHDAQGLGRGSFMTARHRWRWVW